MWKSLNFLGLSDIYEGPGHDGFPAQTQRLWQSTGLEYKPKDWNTISSGYQSLNLQKSLRWIENKT